MFTYDEKGQLKQADFGQLLPGSTPTAAGTFVVSPTHAYEEGNLNYDRNGNILTLRRRDGNGVATSDFTYYNYPYNSNKLTAVSKPGGGVVLDYDYDALGQMTRQRDEQGQRYLTYDVTGKVTGVYRDAAHQQPLVAFGYDDKGFRTSKASYDPTTFQLKKTTYSVRDIAGSELATYTLDATVTGSTLQRSEVPLYGASRLGTLTRLDDGSLDYRYELNDQLGNARVIYHRPATTTYLATMEPGAASQEEKDFTGVAPTRYGRSGHNGSSSVARLGLTNGLKVGPGKVLTVQKGDTITFRAYAWLTAAIVQPGGPHQPLALRVAPLVGAAAVGTGGAPTNARTGPGEKAPASSPANLLTRLSAGVGFTFGAPAATPPATPQTITGASNNAYLHFIIKDAQGNVVRDDYQEANGSSPATWQSLQVGLRLAQGGTVQLSVETDGATGPDVYFDDVQVDYTASTIVQEQHSYAYGAPMPGLNYVIGTKNYRHGYQGQYAEKDEETGTDDFELRNYDSRIGRWTAPDPMGQFASPYVGMGNNPVLTVDPDGGWSWLGAGIGAVAGAGIGGTVSASNGKGFWKGAAIGAAVGFIAGGLLGPDSHTDTPVRNPRYSASEFGGDTWYYMYKHAPGKTDAGHALLFNPIQNVIFEVNHANQILGQPDGKSLWLDMNPATPKSIHYVWNLNNPDNAEDGKNNFWAYRGGRGQLDLFPVEVPNPQAAMDYFMRDTQKKYTYNLILRNCKTYIFKGLRLGGSMIKYGGPLPSHWVNTQIMLGSWRSVLDVGTIPKK